MIALIDYGAGNLTSVRKGFAAAGAELFVPSVPDALRDASAIVVPGVGHFRATAALAGAWRNAILKALDAGTPLFGICLGMQWLFEASDEAPGVPGLGIIQGRCTRLRGGVERGSRVKVPHVGWNLLHERRASAAGIPAGGGTYVYFTHSYAAPVEASTVASCAYGDDEFAAVVEKDNAFGVQFHPEKSGDAGLAILKRFADIAREHEHAL